MYYKSVPGRLKTIELQIKEVPYKLSAFDSSSSFPPLFERVHVLCTDPLPEKDSWCHQSLAPFMSCKLFKKGGMRGEHKKTLSGRLLSPPNFDHNGGWGEFSHQPAGITGLSV